MFGEGEGGRGEGVDRGRSGKKEEWMEVKDGRNEWE